MANQHKLSVEEAKEFFRFCVQAFREDGAARPGDHVIGSNKSRAAIGAAAHKQGLPPGSKGSRYAACIRLLGREPDWVGDADYPGLGKPRIRVPARTEKPFEFNPLPSSMMDIEDLLERRRREFNRIHEAKMARKLIPVRIKMDGPIGIAHFGDPHVDDPGTNIPLLERHVQIVNDTEGLFGANVGDTQNLWIGRMARLYGEQSTSAAESWKLAEWLVTSVSWIYLIAGNHDLWAGAGDPIQWIARQQGNLYEAHGARLALTFSNGREVRVNARHDFQGHSMWNTAHGPSKAAQIGWRDHILTCGHKHTSGYAPVKDPASGIISHAIRAASYKWHDRYADEKGLPDQNMFECPVTIIDPDADERRLVTVIFDPEEGAEYLTWKRQKWASNRRAA